VHHKILIVTALFFVISCSNAKKSNSSDGIEENPDTIEETKTPTDTVAGLSLDSRLKFKTQKLLEQEIMSSLTLEKDQICKELGDLSCLNEAHHLTLGGVDPYEKNIWESTSNFLETTPIVVERIAWSACQKRTELDLESGEQKIFTKGTFNDQAHKEAMVSRVYQNILARDPSAQEFAAMLDFASKLEKQGGSYKDWASLSCFSLLTSVEFLFY